MSKICRTCLRSSKTTFKINQTYEFGSSAAKISYILRFCIPELYLGLSTNPEICFDCKRSLEVAYVFKKKCLNTEQLLGDYLKTIRCTGRSIELQEVLKYITETKLGQKTAQVNTSVNAEDIISEWEDLENDGTVDLPVLEVRQSAPNPKQYYNNSEEIKFCEDTLLLYKRNRLKSVSESIDQPEQTSSSNLRKDTDSTTKNVENTLDFPKITSVFSMSDTPNEIRQSPKGNDSNSSMVSLETSAPGRFIKIDGIKGEPLDVEINSDSINFSYTSMDEETLDSSETARYEAMQCDSALQGILDSLPDIHDSNQYVDVPDFVQINNFGPKELEELRQQQLKVQAEKNLPEDMNKMLTKDNETSTRMLSGQETSNISEGMKTMLPQTLYINGKQMVKYPGGYKFLEEGPALQQTELDTENPPVKVTTVATQVDSRPIRRRRKFKIVPVGEKAALSNKKKSVTKIFSANNENVVVLFTHYTTDGLYVNDHDYLINPYKRNKVLIERDNEWFCMCYICHTEHKVHSHVNHMTQHSGFCKICDVDLGTSYMLNGHVRSHIRPCRQCTERVPYGLIESHNKLHYEEEMKFEDPKKRHCRRKKMSKDEKPVYFPGIPSGEPCKKEVGVEACDEDLAVKNEKQELDFPNAVKRTPTRRSRKRRIKIEECSPPDRNIRVLRSKARKTSSETDLNISKGLDVSPATEPP